MNTLFTGRTLIELDHLPSTNSHAMELIKQGKAPEGALIWAYFQSQGRGQMGNTWQAEKGKNLTFSLVMHPRFLPAGKQFYLSKITSLAVLGMLTEYLPASQYDIQIKWPNDILVDKCKIAGILIENLLRGNQVQNSVIGVGLNVNQTDFHGLEKQATSLALLLKKEVGLKLALELFCKHFEALYLNLKQNKFELINKLYLNNLYRFNSFENYSANGESFRGKITGVEEGGLLVMENEQGENLCFKFKEVQFV